MKLKFFLLILFFFVFLLINKLENDHFEFNPSINIVHNYNLNDIKKVDLLKYLEEIYDSKNLIYEIKINREDNRVFEFGDNYSLFIYSDKLSYDIDLTDDLKSKYDNLEYDVFNEIKITKSQLWNNKHFFKIINNNEIFFSGYSVSKDNIKKAFIYFYNELLSLKVGDVFGEFYVLEIFDDGVLLINKENQLEVIL